MFGGGVRKDCVVYFSGRTVKLGGDGRCDSLGPGAKYDSYTFMHQKFFSVS